MATMGERAAVVGGGAVTGAKIGSFLGPKGTLIGAGIGGLVGLGAVLYDALVADGVEPIRAQQIAADAQAAGIDEYSFQQVLDSARAREGSLAGQQDQYLDTLRAQAAGEGVPSLAEMQLRRGLAQVQQGAAGSMAAQRGLNPALAARLVGQQQAQAGQEFAGQAAMLRAQEQLDAQKLLGATLQGVRGQEQAMFGMGMQGNQAQNQLTSQNFNTAQSLNAQIRENNRRAEMDAQRMNFNAQQGMDQRNLQAVGGLYETGSEYFGNQATRPTPTTPTPGPSAVPDYNLGGPSAWWRGGMVRGYADGGLVDEAAMLVMGVPEVPGDSPRNDTVDAKLSPGEVVIPRSVVNAPDAPDRAAEFVAKARQEAMTDPRAAAALGAYDRGQMALLESATNRPSGGLGAYDRGQMALLESARADPRGLSVNVHDRLPLLEAIHAELDREAAMAKAASLMGGHSKPAPREGLSAAELGQMKALDRDALGAYDRGQMKAVDRDALVDEILERLRGGGSKR